MVSQRLAPREDLLFPVVHQAIQPAQARARAGAIPAQAATRSGAADSGALTAIACAPPASAGALAIAAVSSAVWEFVAGSDGG
jgi:hypothetical protein